MILFSDIREKIEIPSDIDMIYRESSIMNEAFVCGNKANERWGMDQLEIVCTIQRIGDIIEIIVLLGADVSKVVNANTLQVNGSYDELDEILEDINVKMRKIFSNKAKARGIEY